MILVDTSVWVDHLRRGDTELARLLEAGEVLIHPFVIGEIACGSLADRSTILALLQNLPMATVAEADEVLRYIEQHDVHGRGIGYVDAHLLAATTLTGARLLTRDKRLGEIANALGLAYRDA